MSLYLKESPRTKNKQQQRHPRRIIRHKKAGNLSPERLYPPAGDTRENAGRKVTGRVQRAAAVKAEGHAEGSDETAGIEWDEMRVLAVGMADVCQRHDSHHQQGGG